MPILSSQISHFLGNHVRINLVFHHHLIIYGEKYLTIQKARIVISADNDNIQHMKIYIDADACPKAIKEILFKAAMRTSIATILVANNYLKVPKSAFIKSVQVEKGIDVADDYIAAQVEANDLVITADIPLADQVITKGAVALNPRGELYTEANIKERLGLRDHMSEVRASGVLTGGPKAMDAREIQQFANQLDRYLTKMKRQS